MTKANVGEAPRSEATQRYPQLFNEEICSRAPETNTSESQDVIQMARTDFEGTKNFHLSNGENSRPVFNNQKGNTGKFQILQGRQNAELSDGVNTARCL